MPNAEMTKVADLTVVLHRKAKGKMDGLWLVYDGHVEPIGFLTRFNNTRTERHPWKAFVGIGMNAQFLGAFYQDKDRDWMRTGHEHECNWGGKEAALACIAANL